MNPSLRTLIVENKSTIEDIGLGSMYWKRLTIDPQASTYVEAALSLGLDVSGVLYNVLRKPQLQPFKATPVEQRKYTKPTKQEPIPRLYANQRDTDETPDEYFGRLIAAIGEKPAYYYQRGVVVRLEHERVEGALDNWQTAGNIRDARRLNVFPRNPDSCVQYGRVCDYFMVCTGTAEITDPFLFRKVDKKHEELESTNPDLLTQSSIRCYRACPRRFQLRYELCYRSLAPKAEPLRMGTSLHRALEWWWKNDGDLHGALAKLDTDDPFTNAKERAMMVGYHAYWGPPKRVIAVEREWEMPLVNPDTGAASRTFVLGGKTDVLIEDDGAGEQVAQAGQAGSNPVLSTEVCDGSGSETHTEGDPSTQT